MLETIDGAPARLAPRLLPRMGAGMVLRVLSKRARPVTPGAPAPLTSEFTLAALDQDQIQRYGAALGFTADLAPGAVPL